MVQLINVGYKLYYTGVMLCGRHNITKEKSNELPVILYGKKIIVTNYDKRLANRIQSCACIFMIAYMNSSKLCKLKI